MNRKTNTFQILNKTIGANGPSMGLGVPTMMIGIVTVLVGLANMEFLAILSGILILFVATYLILSIDCIAIDKAQNKLYLYKDYYLTTKA